jgi:DNA-binding NtrC family response regulator
MLRLLVVEETSSVRGLLERRLDSQVTVGWTRDIQAALADHKQNPYDVVLWDTVSMHSPSPDPVHILEQLLTTHIGSRAIVLSNAKRPDSIKGRKVRCKWMQRPVDRDDLLTAVQKMVRAQAPLAASSAKNTRVKGPVDCEGILVFSPKMHTVIQHIIDAAAQDIPVLISGETGTGKDMVARAIHRKSRRNGRQFVPVNVGAIAPELVASELFGHERGAYTGASEKRAGLFEQAQGGTLFLDEITTMDEKTQVSLLRALETQSVRRVGGEKDIHADGRIIAATNENIEEAVRQGRFREDLYYRLDVFRIQLPPLRERDGAVSLLTDHFVALFANLYQKVVRSISDETYRLLRAYPWPGNVRELKNVIQRAVLLAARTELTPDLLPERLRGIYQSALPTEREYHPIHLGMGLHEVEREFIKTALSSVNGNKVKAAALLKISRRTLYNKLKRFDLLCRGPGQRK